MQSWGGLSVWVLVHLFHAGIISWFAKASHVHNCSSWILQVITYFTTVHHSPHECQEEYRVLHSVIYVSDLLYLFGTIFGSIWTVACILLFGCVQSMTHMFSINLELNSGFVTWLLWSFLLKFFPATRRNAHVKVTGPSFAEPGSSFHNYVSFTRIFVDLVDPFHHKLILTLSPSWEFMFWCWIFSGF